MGRKPLGRMFELLILGSLDSTFPRTIEYVRNHVSQKLNKPGLSWHTIRKYLIVLRDTGVVEEVHSGKIITYKLKK